MPSTRRSIVVSLLFIVFGGPGILLLYIPYWKPFSHSRRPAAVADASGWPAYPGGTRAAAESIQRFIFAGRGVVPTTPTERLVVGGLYRYVRDSMYVGVVTTLAGEAILFRNLGLVEEAAAAAVLIHLFVVFYGSRRSSANIQRIIRGTGSMFRAGFRGSPPGAANDPMSAGTFSSLAVSN